MDNDTLVLAVLKWVEIHTYNEPGDDWGHHELHVVDADKLNRFLLHEVRE